MPIKHWKLLISIAIFFLAFGVRLLHKQDNLQPPFFGMTAEYRAHALTLVDRNVKAFLRGPNPPSDTNVIKHPPGYPILMAAVYKVFGTADPSERAMQLVDITLDSLAAVLVFILAAEMFSLSVATLAGLLVALSPQLAYHSIAVLPDPLAAPPLLLAIFFLVRAYKRQHVFSMIAAGLFIGISCWLRSNALLLPFFVAALVPFLFKRNRLRMATAVIASSLLVILPVTVRNLVYFRSFIPLSLSAGITLVEGIGVYDTENRFHLPATDYEVTKWEAREFKRPDYLGTRFAPDGLIRERFRMRRGFEVIRSHPFWFAGVMARRAVSMLRLARVELIRSQPAITSKPPDAIFQLPKTTPPITGPTRKIVANDPAVLGESIKVTSNTDYLIKLPLKIERGSLVIQIRDAQTDRLLGYSTILHPVNWLGLTTEQQPFVPAEVPFVSGDSQAVKIVLVSGRGNEAYVAEASDLLTIPLGNSSSTWTRYLRIPLRLLQQLFITAVFLPFTLLGVLVLALRRCRKELAVLLVIPAYYMLVQSILWTEFRYILTMHYFLFILAAVGIVWTGGMLLDRLRSFDLLRVRRGDSAEPQGV
jgi:Dolichyl-phosphate-mannose-protein mannosyltransferase